jgi:CRISPR-associated protein Cmr3
MNQSKVYLIQLIPLGQFFFGGQKRSEAEAPEKDYYFKSLYFPQQTQVLGMLRQELLIQNHLFPLNKDNREPAAALIGPDSFAPGTADQDFRALREISPLFLSRENCYFHPIPFDYGLTLDKKPGKTYLHLKKGKSREKADSKEAAVLDFIPQLEDYQPKKYNSWQLLANTPGATPINYEEIFKEVEQVGIKKGQDGQVKEDAYYKQVFYRLAKGAAYAFYLRLDTAWEYLGKTHKLEFADNIVTMGGERSTFKMKVKPLVDNGDNLTVQTLYRETLPAYHPHPTFHRVVLTGSAFVEPTVLSLCSFAVTGSVFFRNIRTHVRNTWKFSNLKQELINSPTETPTPYLGSRYNLLQRGSVLYLENRENLRRVEEQLTNPQYQKIGYNYFTTILSKGEKS